MTNAYLRTLDLSAVRSVNGMVESNVKRLRFVISYMSFIICYCVQLASFSERIELNFSRRNR